MFFPGQFTLSQSSPPVRNAKYLRTFFFEFIYVFREILSTSMFFCCPIYIYTAQNSRGECNEFADLCCDTRLLDLCILFKFIFLNLWYIPPRSCAFHTFSPLYQFFPVHITTRNIFPIPKWAKTVVLNLGAILFFCGIHFKPLKLWKKYREDLNMHIPQKINEFASLALAGRYP